jgi:hypothetical protein
MRRYRSARGLAALFVVLALAAPAHAIDRRVRILNESSHKIVEFYGVNVGVRSWPESLLGEDALPPGGARILSFDDGSGYCRFRFRAVFDDGVDLVRESVNVCEVGTYRYTD